MHSLLPQEGWYFLSMDLHASHAPLLASGWTVPGPHSVCSVLPVGAKWPFFVVMHWPALVSLVELEYDPGEHGKATELPSGQ